VLLQDENVSYFVWHEIGALLKLLLALRILRLSDAEDAFNNDHKTSIGRGGHRIEASRNIWDGSGLKIESASTDVAWCHGSKHTYYDIQRFITFPPLKAITTRFSQAREMGISSCGTSTGLAMPSTVRRLVSYQSYISNTIREEDEVSYPVDSQVILLHYSPVLLCYRFC
jgi:hypothetical protein